MTQQLSRVDRIEERIDKGTAGAISVTSNNGGAMFRSMGEVMEFSKLMAVSDIAIPKHLRGNPGACMAVCLQAIEWRMSPYAVANKSYMVNDRISYESQLIHAVIEMRAPIEGRLRHSFSGQGDSRRCKVWARVKGEEEPLVFESSTFAQIQPKNSPLWKTKPDVQLFYNASRDWGRMYFPDVILGVYSRDELEDAPAMDTGVRAPVAMPRPLPPAVTSVAADGKDLVSEDEHLRRIEERLAETRANGQQSEETGTNQSTGTDEETAAGGEVDGGDDESEKDEEVDKRQPTSSAPPKISYEDILALGQAKKPKGTDEGAATFRMGQVIRKAAGKVAPGVAVKQVWTSMSAEQQYQIKDAFDAGQFPWTDAKK